MCRRPEVLIPSLQLFWCELSTDGFEHKTIVTIARRSSRRCDLRKIGGSRQVPGEWLMMIMLSSGRITAALISEEAV